MKILQIDQHYQYGGGTEHYMLAISHELEKKGHDVAIVYAKRGDQTVDRSDRRAIQVPYIDDYYPTENRQALAHLQDVISHEEPDLIHIHNIRNAAVINACIARATTIRHVQDPSFVCATHWKLLPNFDLCVSPCGFRCISHGCLRGVTGLVRLYRKRMELLAHRKVAHMLVSSHYVKTMLEQLSVPPGKIAVIHPFTRLPTTCLDAAFDKNIVLFIGKMHPIKGADLLLRALAQVNAPYRGVFIGAGDYLSAYKSLARELGIEKKVVFVGWVPLERLADYYVKCSVLVVPSVWVETFGLIGIDAMAYKKPVVAFDVGGIADWLSDRETGFLVKRGDIKSLAEKITLLLRDKTLASKMGEAGRLKVEQKFTAEIFIERLLDVYHNALAPSRRTFCSFSYLR